ncbi:unnamed protein product [Mytilus coruscus]|uniref:Uncharacterized protein n=1 Tax=Mytilus coruscus TaxID=42192 RepID=A0A6J8CDJ9_MYTCO|nr:unnamed protein product [Mytilus coruscus]
MLRAHSVVSKHLQAAVKRQKDNYDAKLSSQIYQPGQPVWLLNEARQEGRCPKLQNLYQDPFLILKRCRSKYDLNSHTRGYAKHVREVQTLQKNGQTYNERNYLKKASVPYIFEDGRDIVKQSYTESQKHWASRAGIRIKSFPKPTKPTLPKYTSTPIPIAPKRLAPLETSTATCTSASIDSYNRLLQSNMPCLSMPAFSTYSVTQTAPSPYCPPVTPVASSRERTTVTKFVL